MQNVKMSKPMELTPEMVTAVSGGIIKEIIEFVIKHLASDDGGKGGGGGTVINCNGAHSCGSVVVN